MLQLQHHQKNENSLREMTYSGVATWFARITRVSEARHSI